MKIRQTATLALLSGLLILLLQGFMHDLPVGAQGGGATARVSLSSAGEQGNGHSVVATLSADGRYVVFNSLASNLVPGDTNGRSDIFIRDRITSQTTRVSVSSGGEAGNGDSHWPAISADGRFVGFLSSASNLVSGDTNGVADIFVHDRSTGVTSRISISSDGEQANAPSTLFFGPALSADGRFIAFESEASNLVSGDSNSVADIFVHDRATGQTTRVSRATSGAQGDFDSYDTSISADGRYVVFLSHATNLTSGDTNNSLDVFLHDRQTGTTTRESLTSTGAQIPVYSYSPSLSADGRFIVFHTHWPAVPEDTNAWEDVFVRERATGQLTRVSVASNGFQANNGSFDPSISDDGTTVTFVSLASNLVSSDSNDTYDIFVHYRPTGATTRVSVATDGTQGDDASWMPDISADGQLIAFYSYASTLVSGDSNGVADAFVHDRGGGPPPTAVPTATPPVGCGFALENFDGGAADFPPPGWTSADIEDSVCLWESTETTGRQNVTGGSGHAAIGDSQWCGLFERMNTELRTPSFSLVGATNPALSYRFDYFDTNTSDKGFIDLSTDGGENWTRILANDENLRGPRREVVDLSGYAGEPNVTLRFKYVVPESGGWFQVDDVAVSCETSPDVDISPPAIDVTVAPGGVLSDTLSIVNSGNSAGMLLWWLNEGTAAEARPPLAPQSAPSASVQQPVLPANGRPDALAEIAGDAPSGKPNSAPSDLGLSSELYIPDDLLYDNGQLYNSVDTGVGGADESILQEQSLPMDTLGFGHQRSLGHRLADDFTITDAGGWQIDSVTFYGYQTFSGPTSTFTEVNYRIWDGPPNDPSSTVLFGDTTTNRLVNSSWTGINRVTESGDNAFPRPIMANTVSAGLQLPPGTYWLDWQSDGTLDNGPWATPVSLWRHASTGGALQYNGVTGSWVPAADFRAGIPQGFPFTIEGGIVGGVHCAPGEIPWLDGELSSGSTRAGSTDVVNQTLAELTFDATGLAPGVYTGTLCIETSIPAKRLVTVPVSMNVAAVPEIAVEPTAITVALDPGDTVSQSLTIENHGQAALTWTVLEEPGEAPPAASDLQPPFAPRSAMEGLSVPAYGFDLRYRQLVSFTTAHPEDLHTVVEYGTDVYWTGSDFINGDFSALYAIDLFNNRFARFDTAAGAMTLLGAPAPGENQLWQGMAGDPTTGALYASATNWSGSNNCTQSWLHSLDPETGTAALIAPITGAVCIIGIAANGAGQLYGLDIVLDALVTIDKATGAATVIGPLGYDANFSQGMDFDEQTSVLYLSAYNAGVNQAELRVADLATGQTTLLGLLGEPAGTAWLGTMAVATSICSPGDLSWLSVSPENGTTAPGGNSTVTVTFDASGLAPGTYTGALCIASNDPEAFTVRVPVTLVVGGPPMTPTPTVPVTVTSTATAVATPTPTRTATPPPGSTPTASATAQPTPSATSSPGPTMVPTRTPTAAPATVTATPSAGARLLFLPLIQR